MTEAEEESHAIKDLLAHIENQERLLACYRTSSQPRANLLDQLTAGKARVKEIREKWAGL